MVTERTHAVAVYADRAGARWVVRDAAGDFWALPHTDDPWRDREAVEIADGADLEPVPGHYRGLLGLPC